jgi:hypothetical protein
LHRHCQHQVYGGSLHAAQYDVVHQQQHQQWYVVMRPCPCLIMLQLPDVLSRLDIGDLQPSEDRRLLYAEPCLNSTLAALLAMRSSQQ